MGLSAYSSTTPLNLGFRVQGSGEGQAWYCVVRSPLVRSTSLPARYTGEAWDDGEDVGASPETLRGARRRRGGGELKEEEVLG